MRERCSSAANGSHRDHLATPPSRDRDAPPGPAGVPPDDACSTTPCSGRTAAPAPPPRQLADIADRLGVPLPTRRPRRAAERRGPPAARDDPASLARREGSDPRRADHGDHRGSSATQLFAALRTLAGEGLIVLFVSHKLEEVAELCDRVTVLRHGSVAGETELPAPPERLVEMMFGRSVEPPSPGSGSLLERWCSTSIGSRSPRTGRAPAPISIERAPRRGPRAGWLGGQRSAAPAAGLRRPVATGVGADRSSRGRTR